MMNRPDLSKQTLDETVLSRTKYKKMIEDIRYSYKRVPESRYASAHIILNRYKDEDPSIKTASLPDFRR